MFPERKVRVENGRSVDKGASISVEWSKLGGGRKRRPSWWTSFGDVYSVLYRVNEATGF